jgi:RNA polymerase sigma-70 factor, ECF subfamily
VIRIETQRQAFEQLIRAHQAGVYRYLRYLGAQPAVAEDLVQETFLATLQSNPHQPKDGDTGGWDAWLRGIARNKFLAECRRSASHAIPLADPLLEQAELAWMQRVGNESDWDDRLGALKECLKTLPARQREALDHRYVRHTGRDAMAQALGMSADGIKSLLRRIRTALAECVNERLGAMRTR